MSYYVSLSGLQNAQTDLAVTGNNIANANTTGFKKSSTEFANLVATSAYTNPKLIVGIGATVQAVNQNFAQGPIEQTGSALDLAISGDGFFTVRNPTTNQLTYTRNGAFSTNAAGNIVNSQDDVLQVFAADSAGVIDTTKAPVDSHIPPTNAAGAKFNSLTIAKDGTISAAYDDGTSTALGKVALAEFASAGGLKQAGYASYTPTNLSGQATYGAPNSGQYGGLQSGALEASNVDLSTEMVNLITAQQYFQANAKAIDSTTTIFSAALNLKS